MSGAFLDFLALGLAVAGLLAVILEIAVRDPSVFLEIATDSRRMAMLEATRSSAPGRKPMIGYAVPAAAANEERRVA